MNKALLPYLQKYDQVLEELWQACEGLTDEQLNWKPNAYSWSIAQVHEHLMMSEKLSIRYLEKKLQYPQGLKKAGLKSWWNFSRLAWVLKSPFKVKAPKAVAEVPEYTNREALMKDWNATRSKMKTLLEAVPAYLIKTNVYKHPLVGKFSLIHMLRFFHIHISGHIKQVERIKAAMP